MPKSYDHQSYFTHGMNPSDEEVAWRDKLNSQLPDQIIDAHVHNSTEDSFNPNEMSDFTWSHMVSTYPVTTVEQSQQISDIMLPGKEIRRLRFAHAFRGIAHAIVNDYLVENAPAQDRVAFFGLHETPEEIDYTVAELEGGAGTKYHGLKMYYSAGSKPVYDLYKYFPKPVLTEAERSETPIILHLPNSAENSLDELKDISESFPHLRIVLAHIGVTWIDNPELERVFSEVASYGNIAVDTSGVTDRGVIEKAIRYLGANYILFGTDEPLNLLREQTYDNPSLGPRIITDYPYHWVDPVEWEQFKDTVPTPTYSHLQQLAALEAALDAVTKTEAEKQAMAQAIFYDNAKKLFGF